MLTLCSAPLRPRRFPPPAGAAPLRAERRGGMAIRVCLRRLSLSAAALDSAIRLLEHRDCGDIFLETGAVKTERN